MQYILIFPERTSFTEGSRISRTTGTNKSSDIADTGSSVFTCCISTVIYQCITGASCISFFTYTRKTCHCLHTFVVTTWLRWTRIQIYNHRAKRKQCIHRNIKQKC